MLIIAHETAYEIEVDSDSHIGRRIAETRQPFEVALLERIYQQGYKGVAVDVGANIGNHALWFAAVCGLEVVAFEPVTVDELLANVHRNELQDRIDVVPVALGAESGSASDRGIRAGTDHDPAKGYETWGFNHKLTLGEGEIPVARLDDYELSGVALIKVDVEGMEADVLRGGTETIRRNRPDIYAESLTGEHSRTIGEVLGPDYRRRARFNRGTPLDWWAPC